MDYIIKVAIPMLEGMKITLSIFALTIIFSIPLGLIVALGRISKWKVLSLFMSFYIWILRGTPLMLQLFFVYFGLPKIPFIGIVLDRFNAAVFTFILNYAAYFAEIFRAGIQSIDKGQYEAAKDLGLSYWQTLRRILIPQMLKKVLPPICNETITLVKDTSLASAIALVEISSAAQTAVTRDGRTTPFLLAAIFYLFLSTIVSRFFMKCEKRFSVYE